MSNLTISGVAYKIWLNMTNSMPEIARIANNTTLAKDIREAYYGGIAEVHVPTVGYDVNGNNVEVNANYYDVNSLYPSVMVEGLMPLGTVEEVKYGAKLSEMFGFCYAKVSVDETMKVPFLPLRGPDRVMAVTGNWEGWYFSEELKYAEGKGYKIEVLRGYNFLNKGYIFKGYIEPIYKLKSSASDIVERSINKLLLNSLYGMMGYRGDETKLDIHVKEGKMTNTVRELEEGHNNDYSINVAIAAAVTAYARIKMNELRDRMVYTNTDSAVVHGELEPSMVSPSELGMFKHEFRIKNAVFKAPKTYGVETWEGDIKIASAGIKKGLVTLEDLYRAIIGNKEAMEKVYKFDAFKRLVDVGSMSITSVKFTRKTPGLADGRARIEYTHKDSGVVTWIGTLAWRLVDGKLIDPTSYMIGNMVVMKEFDVSKQGMEGVSVAKGSVEEMQKKMNRSKGKATEKIASDDDGVVEGKLGYEETEEKIKRKKAKCDSYPQR